MALTQVQNLIQESVVLNYPWKRWFLTGGEPTLHPQLEDIVYQILRYRWNHNRQLEVTIATNGYSDDSKKRIESLLKKHHNLHVLNSQKTGPLQPTFIAPCLAPRDIDPDWSDQYNYLGCNVSWSCGLGLNYQGFYPCSIAGAIDRVFSLNQSIPSLQEVSGESIRRRYKIFCPLCGHYLRLASGTEQVISSIWKEVLKEKTSV